MAAAAATRMSETHTIVIAEDRTIVREGLRLLVCANPCYRVVAEARDGYEAVSAAREHLPDLLLLDLSMPRRNGIEAIRDIVRASPGTRILVLTVHDTEEFVTAALQAGAHGYVLKEASQSELMLAIKNVLAGRRFISPGISDTLINGYLEGRLQTGHCVAADTLTHREREVLKLIAEGYRSRQISEMLFISSKTIEKHRENIMRKLDLHNTAALTAYAIEHGLIERRGVL